MQQLSRAWTIEIMSQMHYSVHVLQEFVYYLEFND